MRLAITAVEEALVALVTRLQRSLVVVHTGREGSGAGVVWRRGGYIVTNDHVISHGLVGVTLPDGRERQAEVVARRPALDLALLRVDAPELPPVPIADARAAQVGQPVLALGYPWGQRGRVTLGILSALGHALQGDGYTPVPILCTDAALAPGNSGGSLVALSGRVIGINAMIVGGDQGIAIPSHVVEAFVQEILGRVDRGIKRCVWQWWR